MVDLMMCVFFIFCVWGGVGSVGGGGVCVFFFFVEVGNLEGA